MNSAIARVLYLVAFLALGVFYYFFFGPGPTASELSQDLPWWRPLGGALRWRPSLKLLEEQGMLRTTLLFLVPPAAFSALAFAMFRSAIARTLALGLGLSLMACVTYGYLAEGQVWRFFSWRFFATVLSVSLVAATFSLSPALLRSAFARGRNATFGLLLAAFVAILLLSTEITGTDPNLRFNVSPWPAVTLYGFLFFGYALAAIHVAAGAGAAVMQRIEGPLGMASGITAAALTGAALSAVVFDASSGWSTAALALGAALSAGLGARSTEMALLAQTRVVAGCLIAAFILSSNRIATSYQTAARNDKAIRLIDALSAYYNAHEAYPDELEELVPEYLQRVPRARMGLLPNRDENFIYSNFGESYGLEFASVLWVQCAYSPPFREYEDEGDDEDVAAGGDPLADEAETLEPEGNWSCESTPPKLW